MAATLQQESPDVLLVARNGIVHFADLEVSELVKRRDAGHP